MPQWVIVLFMDLAVKLGLPWLMAHFPWIPEGVREALIELIEKLEGHENQKQALITKAKEDVRKCYGEGCEIQGDKK